MTNEELIKRITDLGYDHGHDIYYLAADRIETLKAELDKAVMDDWKSEVMRQNALLHDALTRAAAAEAKLAKAVAMLEKAKTYIADLEAHEGSEGFSASTNYYAADYYDALSDGETK